MKKIFLATTIAFSFFSSCSRLDDNISPNMVEDKDIPARQKLAAAETTAFDAQTGDLVELSSVWMNTWSGNIYFYANPYSQENTLSIDSRFRNQVWNSTYLSVANLQAIIDGSSNRSLPLHAAIAKILKANYLHYIGDLYSDAPHTEAFKQQGNLSPKYDKGESIYMDLIKGINEAIATIDNTVIDEANKVKGNEDVIFSGDMDKWRQFANTVKLRMLLRMSNVTDATIKSFVISELIKLNDDTKPFASRFITEDVTINPGYNSGIDKGLNPIYRRYGYTNAAVSSVNNYWRLMKVSDHYAKIINGDLSKPTAGVVDPRGIQQFTSVGGKLVGIVQGPNKVPGTTQNDYSSLGGNFRKIATIGGVKDGYLMLLSEAKFLLSEAAIVYPQYFSNAKMYYEEGVQASFLFYGLSLSSATTYLATIAVKPHVGWDATVDKLEPLQYQRLISLANYRPMETYFNYLKTGFPDTPLATNAQEERKPYRIIYPVSEYTGNSANVPNITAAECFTKNQYTPFWLR